jgi:hypothetical protein
MDIEKLTFGQKLLNTLATIGNIIQAIEALVGIPQAQKDALTATMQAHHADVQKQLNDL